MFEYKGRIVATAHVAATLIGSNGPVPSDDMLAEISQYVTKPSKPEIVAKLREIENLIHETQKE